jgi:hypothetical protein
MYRNILLSFDLPFLKFIHSLFTGCNPKPKNNEGEVPKNIAKDKDNKDARTSPSLFFGLGLQPVNNE